MASVGADEGPRTRDQAEHVARTQLASVGERQLACGRRRGDGQFSVQSDCADSLAGSSARDGQYVVLENEFRCASYFVLIGAEPVSALAHLQAIIMTMSKRTMPLSLVASDRSSRSLHCRQVLSSST